MTRIGGNTPDIGIVVTAHNYERYLDQCIQSVIEQSDAPSWNMIIVDDGSSDNSHRIISSFLKDQRISSIKLNGVGLAAASNKGIALIRSKWIIRLDADDWLSPNALESLYRRVLESGADICFGDLRLVDEHGANIGFLSQSRDGGGTSLECSPVGSGMLYRRRVWQKLGGYDESLPYQEDFDFWLKAVEKFTAVHEPSIVYTYRKHNVSMSTNRIPRARYRSVVKRATVQRRGLSTGGEILGVIDPFAFLQTTSDLSALFLKLNGFTLLDLALKRLIDTDGVTEVVVRSTNRNITRWAQSRNVRCIEAFVGNDYMLDIYQLMSVAEFSRHVIALACVPYFPMLEPFRSREAIDSLLLGDYDRVDMIATSRTGNVNTSSNGRNIDDEHRTDTGLTAAPMLSAMSAAWIKPEADTIGVIDLEPKEKVFVNDADSLDKALSF